MKQKLKKLIKNSWIAKTPLYSFVYKLYKSLLIFLYLKKIKDKNTSFTKHRLLFIDHSFQGEIRAINEELANFPDISIQPITPDPVFHPISLLFILKNLSVRAEPVMKIFEGDTLAFSQNTFCLWLHT
jgi:hypothetical protein